MVGVVILQIIIFESHHLSHAAHADYFLNEMADERAETGCLANHRTLIQYAMGTSNMAPYNFVSKPHCLPRIQT